MKKSIIFAVVAVAVMSASCRKERTCTCDWTTTTTTSGGGTSTTTESKGTEKTTMNEIKKRDARVWGQCLNHTDKWSSTQTFGGTTYTTEQSTVNNCELE